MAPSQRQLMYLRTHTRVRELTERCQQLYKRGWALEDDDPERARLFVEMNETAILLMEAQEDLLEQEPFFMRLKDTGILYVSMFIGWLGASIVHGLRLPKLYRWWRRKK